MSDTRKIHTTVGVYLNGDYKTNGVAEEHLEDHIQYNKDYRPGRALLVDGKVINAGYYGVAGIKSLEEKFGHIKVTECTVPYH